AVSAVVGCTDLLQISAGGHGDASVVPGQTTTGSIVITWRHRYTPGLPTDYAASDGRTSFVGSFPYWRANIPYAITFTVLDHCKSDAAAPNASGAPHRIARTPETTGQAGGGQGAGRRGRAQPRGAVAG